MAVPLAVCQVTVIVLVLAFDSETVKLAGVVPLFPSTTETSLIVIETGSSSVIVPTPWASAIVTPVGVGIVRLTTNVSFPSLSVSPLTVTATVLLVCPGVKVSTVAGTAT